MPNTTKKDLATINKACQTILTVVYPILRRFWEDTLPNENVDAYRQILIKHCRDYGLKYVKVKQDFSQISMHAKLNDRKYKIKFFLGDTPHYTINTN